MISVLTDDQRQTLRFALDPLMPMPKKMALDVFAKLVELDPALEESFGGDLDEWAVEFARSLSGGIVHLIDENAVAESLKALGVAMRRRGILERDYDTLGRALVEVFAQRLGDDLTVEGKDAWLEAWDRLATEMQKAAIAVPAAPAVS